MPRSAPVDGFQLAYEREGSGPAVVLLHGWPGDRTDYRAVRERLRGDAELVIPDLRGFGESDKHLVDPIGAYPVAPQARSVLGLVEELGLERPVVAGYDIGSRIAQEMARTVPDRVRAIVVTPPVPGMGERVLSPDANREFWYQSFHRLELAEHLVDGKPDAVRAYLRHFWSHWSGPGYEPAEDDLDHLVQAYAAPGAFTASIGWYRAASGSVARALAEVVPDRADRIVVATTVLWPEHDPLFPREWSDRIDDFFADAALRFLDGPGHFVPLEAPDEFASAICERLAHA